MMHNPLDWYSLCVVVLFLKMFATSAYQGFYRLSRRVFLNPEDAQVFQKPPAAEELPQVKRAAKAWLNDLENIPIIHSQRKRHSAAVFVDRNKGNFSSRRLEIINHRQAAAVRIHRVNFPPRGRID